MKINRDEIIINSDDKKKKEIISETLMKKYNNLIKENQDKKDIVILCIGTDRSTGDSLGPLVGHFLVTQKCKFPVYGTLKKPIHALNIKNKLDIIKNKYKDSIIIAIDAALGNAQSINNIKISNTPIKPGAGVGKELPSIGSISIMGIVNTNEHLFNFETLQNTRLYDVYSLAKNISNGVLMFTNKLYYLNNSKKIRKENKNA